jgi:DNA-binding transcriptional LysR family regulator
VTEQIQALEADLGTALFDCSRRRLHLTEAGQRLLEYAGDLLALADEARAAVADAASLSTGRLTISALETLCANWQPPLLATYQAEHPAVRLQLKVAGSGELRNGVRSGVMGVCFAFGAGSFEPDLQHEPVAEEGLVVIAPPGHRLSGREMIQAEDLAGEPFLVTETGCVYRHMFESAFPAGQAGWPRLAGEFSSIAAIRRLVAPGVGCALVPRLVASKAGGSLAASPWGGDVRSVPISMIWRRRRIQPRVLRHFLEAARQGTAALRPDDARPHMQHGPCDETVAHEEPDRVGDILRLADPADRQTLGHHVQGWCLRRLRRVPKSEYRPSRARPR